MKIISILLLLASLIQAANHTNMYTHDASDQSKKMTVSIDMTVCSVTMGAYHGLYVKAYQGNEKHRTCEELAPLFEHVTIEPYRTGKRKSGNAGSVSFGKKSHQCHIELSKKDGKLVGIPYGEKTICAGIRSEGTIVLKKNAKKQEEPKVPYEIKIFKYGSPHGTGQSFPSKAQCEKEKATLSKVNAGLDYSYKCVKK